MALCFGAGFMIIGEALRILGCVCDQFGLYEKLGILIGTQVLGVQEIGGIVIGVYEPYPPKETGTVVITGTVVVVVALGKFDAVSHLNESAHFSLLVPDVL
jgi:hypothetical protein